MTSDIVYAFLLTLTFLLNLIFI